MNTISFPTQYKQAIISGMKDTTIRIDKEIGKYKKGQIYTAKSYAGKDWKVKIIIIKVIPTTFSELTKHDIPKKSIDSIARKHKLFPENCVEIIRFEVVR